MTYFDQNLINQQLIISKLKKEAKKFKKENPQYTLMQSQDIIAKKHGFLHWHELHTNIKNQLTFFSQSNLFSLENSNHFYLGKDFYLSEKIYIDKNFSKLKIEDNLYSKDNLFNLYTQILDTNSRFVYCKTGLDNNLSLEKEMIDYANKKNIHVYHLSFLSSLASNNFKNLSINFNNVSSGFLAELFSNLVLEFEDDDSIMWKGRAISMISSVMMALVYMRDKENFNLTPNSIREYLLLDKVISLYHKDFPLHIHTSLKSYLFSLPGFIENSLKQNDNVFEHHGYLQMQFIRALGIMCDSYSHIFNNNEYSLQKVLSQKEKSLIIIHFPNFETSVYEMKHLFTIFHSFFIQSFNKNISQKSSLNFHNYVLHENILFDVNLPTKLIALPIHFIQNNKNKSENYISFSENNIFKIH